MGILPNSRLISGRLVLLSTFPLDVVLRWAVSETPESSHTAPYVYSGPSRPSVDFCCLKQVVVETLSDVLGGEHRSSHSGFSRRQHRAASMIP